MREAWTVEDSAAATSAGWDVFNADGKLEIQRRDEFDIFGSDQEAVEFVSRMAATSALHQKALRHVAAA